MAITTNIVEISGAMDIDFHCANNATAAIAAVAIAALLMFVPVVGWWPSLVVAVAVWVMHRANIARLLKGEEPKSSFTKKA